MSDCRYWLQEPSFDGEPETEISIEDQLEEAAEKNETPLMFLDETEYIKAKDTKVKILAEKYSCDELAEALVELFEIVVLKSKEIQQLKKADFESL